jgi:hypothetical protein
MEALARYDKKRIGIGGLVFLKKARLNCSAPFLVFVPMLNVYRCPGYKSRFYPFLLK